MKTREQILKDYEDKYNFIENIKYSLDDKNFAFIAKKEN
jgi:hypothetical protein